MTQIKKICAEIERLKGQYKNESVFRTVKTDTVKEAVLHCYVCGVEVDENDVIEGPEIPICPHCYTKWQDRCYQQLEEMKKEVKK